MQRVLMLIFVYVIISERVQAQVSTKVDPATLESTKIMKPGAVRLPPQHVLVESLMLSAEEAATREALSNRPECWMFPLNIVSTPAESFPQGISLVKIKVGQGSSKTKSPALFAPVSIGLQTGETLMEQSKLLGNRNWFVSGGGSVSRTRSRMTAKREIVTYKSTSTADLPSIYGKIARRFAKVLWLGFSPSWTKVFSKSENKVDFSGLGSSSVNTSRRDVSGFSLGIEYQSRLVHGAVEYSLQQDVDQPSTELSIPARIGLASGYFLGGEISLGLSNDHTNEEKSTKTQFSGSVGRQFSSFALEIVGRRTVGKISSDAGKGSSDSDQIDLRIGRGFFKGPRILGTLGYQKLKSTSPSRVTNKGETYSLGVTIVNVI
jgi:hypothetical protein